MEIKDRIQNQIMIISRFDNLYNSVNNKANFLIAFHSFLVGAIILGNNKITDNIKSVPWKSVGYVLLIILVSCAFVSITLLLKSVYPYTQSGNDSTNKYHSLIFFKSINEFKDAGAYLEKLDQTDHHKFYKDLVFQTYQLSAGLTHKFKMLARATIFIYIEGFIVIFMLIIVLFQ
jgi:Family of unknown function (DUF5706)